MFKCCHLASFSSADAAPCESVFKATECSEGGATRSLERLAVTTPSFFGGFGMQPLPALQM